MKDLARQRLRNQRLAGSPLKNPEDVVKWFGAMQAQEYVVAKWSIGQRMSRAANSSVEAALAEGTILRTHALRPTWHFLHQDDIRWITELTAPRVQRFNAYWYRVHEVDAPLIARATTIIGNALTNGIHLTRKELSGVLEREGIKATGSRLASLVMHAELDLVICSGKMKGKQQTYALVEHRAPGAKSLSRDESLAELTRRYFTSHGPATTKDYRWWSSLTSATVKEGLELVKGEIESFTSDGRTYWHGESPRAGKAKTHTVHLLQGYDEYIIAYSESKDVLNVARLAGKAPRGNALYMNAIALNGQVIGHWRRSIRAKTEATEIVLARRLDAGERAALDHAIVRYEEFYRQ